MKNNKPKKVMYFIEKMLIALGLKRPLSKAGSTVDSEGTPFLNPTANLKNIVKIKMTGSRRMDNKLANKLAGFDKTPNNYTWHHLDDYDPMTNTCTMQLVDAEIFIKCYPLYGAIEIVKQYFSNNSIYRSNKEQLKKTKKIEITDSEQNITRRDILEFEKEYQIKLPENYLKFLLKYNGGQVDDDEWEDVQCFNSLKYGKLTLEETLYDYCIIEDLLDKDYLPISNGYGSNPITLCLKAGEDYGKIIIFYFDMDEEPQIIADSLEELLGVKSIDEL